MIKTHLLKDIRNVTTSVILLFMTLVLNSNDSLHVFQMIHWIHSKTSPTDGVHLQNV